MASALRDTGSTRRWRKLRDHYAAQLPLPCPYCGLMIQPGEKFDLDHAVPRSSGGQDDQLRPAHPKCNRRAGIAITHAQQRAARPKLAPTGTYERDVALGLESRDRPW